MERLNEFSHINALFNRALASSSLREKQFVLNDVKNSSYELVCLLEEVTRENERKCSILSGINKETDEIKCKLRDTHEVVKTANRLLLKGDSMVKNEAIGQIMGIEAEIKRMFFIDRPDPNEINEKSSNLKIYDRKVKSLEDLVFYLRKKVSEIEESHDKFPSVLSQYGSISNLYDQFNRENRENKLLKSFEKTYANDKIAKRRSLNSVNMQVLRNLTLIYQNEINEAHDLMEMVNNGIRFEGTAFEFIGQEFSEPVAVSQEENDKARQEFENVLNSLEKSEKSLMNDYNDQDQRFLKHFAVANHMFSKIKGIRNQYMQHINECEKLFNMIMLITKEKRFYHNQVFSIYPKISSLIQQITICDNNLYKNKTISKTMMCLCSSMGIRTKILEDYLNKQSNNEFQQKQKQLSSTSTHRSSRAKKKDNGTGIPISIPVAPTFFSSNYMKIESSFFDFQMLFIMQELIEKGKNRRTAEWRALYKSLIGLYGSFFAQYQKIMNESLKRIREANAIILSYPKNSIGLQSVLSSLCEMGTQYELEKGKNQTRK